MRDEEPGSADVRALIEELDDALRDAESVRWQVERTLRQRPFWPERRQPRRWSHDEDTSHPDEA